MKYFCSTLMFFFCFSIFCNAQVQAEFVSSSETIPQIALKSINGQVNEISTNNNGDFIIFSNGNVADESFRILDQNGYVGLNNGNPQHRLDVGGSCNVSSFLFSARSRINGNADGNAWALGVTGDQINREGKLFLTNKSAPTGPDDMGITFANNADTERISMHITKPFGNFARLNFSSNNTPISYITAFDGSYNTVSDIRHKKSISSIDQVLNKVQQLQVKTYNYKHHVDSDSKTIGLIAQDVQDIFPEAVSSDGEFLAINYSMFGVIAMKAIQEQQTIITDQKKDIESLESTLLDTVEKLSLLEKKMEVLTQD